MGSNPSTEVAANYWRGCQLDRDRTAPVKNKNTLMWCPHKATRAHRGYWFMAGTSIVQRALDNRWLSERGVPSLKEQWVEMHYGRRVDPQGLATVNLTGTA